MSPNCFSRNVVCRTPADIHLSSPQLTCSLSTSTTGKSELSQGISNKATSLEKRIMSEKLKTMRRNGIRTFLYK